VYHLDCDFGVLVREFERIAEHFEVLLEGQGCSRQLLLVHVDVLIQLCRMIHEDQFAIALQQSYDAS